MSQDKAMKILKSAQERLASDIPLNLIKQCYEAEKQFLFEKERDRCMDSIKGIVEEYVTSEVGGTHEAA